MSQSRLETDQIGMNPIPMPDARLIEALQSASSLQLYQLSTVIDRMLADPRRILEIRKDLHLGQTVQFLDWPDGQPRQGTIVELKKRQVVLHEIGAYREWTLSYTAIAPPGDSLQPAPPPGPTVVKPTRGDFQRGDRVSFEDRYLQTQVGVIVRVNQKTASIDTGDGGNWRVSFALLRHVHDV
ncbi:MAG: hypothetical protein R3E87_21610 [Burkholderiaceae bacterium]